MESNRGVLTFKSVDEIQWCYESNEIFLSVLSHSQLFV